MVILAHIEPRITAVPDFIVGWVLKVRSLSGGYEYSCVLMLFRAAITCPNVFHVVYVFIVYICCDICLQT